MALVISIVQNETASQLLLFHKGSSDENETVRITRAMRNTILMKDYVGRQDVWSESEICYEEVSRKVDRKKK